MEENSRPSFQDFIDSVAGDLDRVEEMLVSDTEPSLRSIGDMNEYVHNSGGKRIRPALLLFISEMLGAEKEVSLKLATIIECIHAATLVHDDVIDEASTRRGRESLNAVHKNKEAVLFGDWLYMTAFWKSLELQEFKFLHSLISVTRQMVEGELLQKDMAFDSSISVETRERITYCKTAGLFSCSCRLGAQAADAEEKTEEAFSRFGEFLGMTFQTVDDMLDFTAREESLGKPVLQDLSEGNLTLPVIYLLEDAGGEDKSFLEEMIRGGNPDLEAKNRVLDLIGTHDSLARTAQRARYYATRAGEFLEELETSEDNLAMLRFLPEWVLARSY